MDATIQTPHSRRAMESLLDAMDQVLAIYGEGPQLLHASRRFRSAQSAYAAAGAETADGSALPVPVCAAPEFDGVVADVLAGRRATFDRVHACAFCGQWPGTRLTVRRLDNGTVLVRVVDAESGAPWNEWSLRDLFENTPVPMSIISDDGRLRAVNEAFQKLFRLTNDVVGRIDYPDFTHPDDRERTRRYGMDLFATRHVGSLEKRNVRADGSVFWVRVNSTLVPATDARRAWALTILEDVDERRQAEDALRAALAEKDVLLREIHHRVKNHLQLVTSLLSLQRDTTHEPSARAALRESCERVRTIAVVHELLHGSDDVAHVDLVAYVRRLVLELDRVHERPDVLACVLGPADVELCAEQLVPCGLVVHELVSNAYEHAFPHGRSGTIRVEITRHVTGRVTIGITDDGIGCPESARGDTLGLELVRGLVSQLGGSLDRTQTGAGCTVAFTFRPC